MSARVIRIARIPGGAPAAAARVGAWAALAIALAPAAAVADEAVRLAPYSPAAPCLLRGGKSPPQKPRNWEDTRYLEVTPAMTIAQGNVMVIEGFAFPEPGAPLCSVGGFRAAGMAPPGRPKGRPTALRVVLDYGGGTEVHLNRICPGLLIRTPAKRLELFTRERIEVDPWRVAGGHSRPPAHLAFSAGGKVKVVKAAGTIDLSAMSEPWIVAWWGPDHGFDVPVRPAGGGPRRNIWPIYPADSDLAVRPGAGQWPMLLVCRRRPAKLTCAPDGWTLQFATPAGDVRVAPLFGRRWVPTETIARWAAGLPDRVARHARRWADRLRCPPIDVTQTHRLAGGAVEVTERFTCDRAGDDWPAPPRPWAPIPPMFALARAEGFPIAAAGGKELADWDWIGRVGPVAGIDGAEQVTYRIAIPQLRRYLAPPKPAPAGGGGDRRRRLRQELAREIDEVLSAGPLAPHMWTFGEMSAAQYTPTYFHNPPQTFATLIATLGHLDAGRAEKLRGYLRREFARCGPFALPHWGEAGARTGARRERFPEDAQARHWVAGANFNLGAIHAAWLYARSVADNDELPGIWEAAKACLARHRRRAAVEWDYTERVRFPVRLGRLGWHTAHGNHPSVETRYESFNSRINGLIGCARLARRMRDPAGEQTATCLLARALALRFAQVRFDSYLIGRGVHEGDPAAADAGDPGTGKLRSLTLLRGLYVGPRLAWTYIWKQNAPESARGVGARVYFFHVNHPIWSTSSASGGVAGGRDPIDTAAYFLGLDLTPAAAAFYRDYCLDFAAGSFAALERTCPTWFMADGPTYFSSEESVGPPEVGWACFLLKAMVLDAPGRELYDLVDFPTAARGDLYHIQKLSAALDAKW